MPETAVASPTPETQTATPGATSEPVSSAPGTAPTNGSEAAGAAPSGESFYSGDINSLPPELQQAYQSMLKDYKQKTMSIADVRKKAEAYDAVSKDQRFVDYWKGLNQTQKADFKEQKQEAEKRLGEKISDEEFTKAFQSKDDFLSFLERVVQDRSEKSQKKIEKLEQQLSVKDAADLVESFATEIDKEGKAIRPDFYSLDEDQLITGFVQVNPPENKSQAAHVARLNEAYAWAKSISQKYYEKGKAEALQVVQKKVAASTEPPTQAAKGAYSGPKVPSVQEAIALAKKGIRVPRDD